MTASNKNSIDIHDHHDHQQRRQEDEEYKEYLLIVEQNNLSVAHLMNENFNDANRCLRFAFEMVRKHVLIHTTNNNNNNKNKNTSSSTVSTSQQERTDGSTRRKQRTTKSSRTVNLHYSEEQRRRQQYIDILKTAAAMNDNNSNINSRNCYSRTRTRQGFMIYSSAVINNKNDNNGTGIQWSIVCAYIVFNLGLLFYSHAQQQQQQAQGCHDNLQTALRMFENALKLLVQSYNNNSSPSSSLSSNDFLKRATGNPLIDLFYMTLLTKLGQVHSDLLSLSSRSRSRSRPQEEQGEDVLVQPSFFNNNIHGNKVHRYRYELSKMVQQFFLATSTTSSSFLGDNYNNTYQQEDYYGYDCQQQQLHRSSSSTRRRRSSSTRSRIYQNDDLELKYLLQVNGLNLLMGLGNHILNTDGGGDGHRQTNDNHQQVQVVVTHQSTNISSATTTTTTSSRSTPPRRTPYYDYDHAAPAA